MDVDTTATFSDRYSLKRREGATPGLLVARTADGEPAQDYCRLDGSLIIGRGQAPLGLLDQSISKQHLRISLDQDILNDFITETLTNAYHRHEGNVSAIERELKDQGITYSRWKISKMLDNLGLNRSRRKRAQ